MSEKIRGPLVVPLLKDGVTVPISEPGTGVRVNDQFCAVRKCRLTLSGFAISVANAQDYGGTKLCDLPDRNMLILGIEVDCVVTKQGNTNGIVAATDITMGVGSAVASNATLSGAMIDYIEGTAITADALAVDFEKHTNDQSTATFPKKVVDAASTALYMNIAAAITADSSVTVDGFVDIFYVDLGNLSS